MKVAVGSRMGLRSRLVLLALAMLIPTYALQTTASLAQRDKLTLAAQARVREVASEMVAQAIETAADGTTLVHMLVQMPALATADDANCQTMLASIMRDAHSISSASIVRADGEVSCTSYSSVSKAANVADRAWFRQARSVNGVASAAPAPVMSDLVVSRLTANPTIVIAQRLPLRLEVVAVTMDLASFSNPAATSSDDILLVVDPRNGVVVAQCPPRAGEQPNRQQALDTTLLAALRGSRQGAVETAGVDGVMRIFGYATLTGLSGGHYMIAVGVRRAMIGADASRQFYKSLLWQSLAGAAAIGVALALARPTLLRPLQLLSDAADRLGQGELRVRVPLERLTMPEFRAVAVALNSAAGQIESATAPWPSLWTWTTSPASPTAASSTRCWDASGGAPCGCAPIWR